MPELPEVETIRRQLAPLVEGMNLERVEILDPRRSHRPADRTPGQERQVPAVELRGRCSPRPAPAHDRRGAERARSPARAHPRPTRAPLTRGRPAAETRDRPPPPVRYRRTPAGLRGGGRFLQRSPRARAVRRALHREAPAFTHARTD